MKESMVSPAIAKALGKTDQALSLKASTISQFISCFDTNSVVRNVLIGGEASSVLIGVNGTAELTGFKTAVNDVIIYLAVDLNGFVYSGWLTISNATATFKRLVTSQETSGKTLDLLLTKKYPVHIHFSDYSFGGHIIAGVSDTEFVEVLFANGYAYINNHGSGQITCTFDKTTYTDFTISTTAANNGFVSVYVPSRIEVTFSRS